jgi:hypothetical protein
MNKRGLGEMKWDDNQIRESDRFTKSHSMTTHEWQTRMGGNGH